MSQRDEAARVAFNLGCQARLDGKPISDNPFPSEGANEYRAWEMGWRHVASMWGVDARWPIKKLPMVTAA